jgi:predicted O-methyltransferase YrrM
MPLRSLFHSKELDCLNGYGTENVIHLLYALVIMHRPAQILEIGIGLSTISIASAMNEYSRDNITQNHSMDVIDDLSERPERKTAVFRFLEENNLTHLVKFHHKDYRDFAVQAEENKKIYDMIFFDCGDESDYINFINKYWDLLSQEDGLLILHYTYIFVSGIMNDNYIERVVASPIVNELKRQLTTAGQNPSFELISFVEPNKRDQNSVTILRRTSNRSAFRPTDWGDETEVFYGRRLPPIRIL